MTDHYEKQKEASGSLASIVFIISSLYLFITNLGFGSLFSFKALGFIIVGMFAAAIVIGIPSYLLERATGKLLMRTVSDPFSDTAIKKIKMIGLTLLIFTVVITFIVTKLVFQWLIV